MRRKKTRVRRDPLNYTPAGAGPGLAGFIRAKINELSQIYNIREIAYDRWGTQKISTELQEDGLTIVPFGQGFSSMAAPSKQLEELLLGRKVAHANNPVLTWMASNVAVRQDAAGNMKPDKSRSADRIDGIVALVMAVGRAAVHIDVTPGVWVIG